MNLNTRIEENRYAKTYISYERAEKAAETIIDDAAKCFGCHKPRYIIAGLKNGRFSPVILQSAWVASGGGVDLTFFSSKGFTTI